MFRSVLCLFGIILIIGTIYGLNRNSASKPGKHVVKMLLCSIFLRNL